MLCKNICKKCFSKNPPYMKKSDWGYFEEKKWNLNKVVVCAMYISKDILNSRAKINEDAPNWCPYKLEYIVLSQNEKYKDMSKV